MTSHCLTSCERVLCYAELVLFALAFVLVSVGLSVCLSVSENYPVEIVIKFGDV